MKLTNENCSIGIISHKNIHYEFKCENFILERKQRKVILQLFKF